MTNVTMVDAGTYSVEVSGSCNTVTNSAELWVNLIPAVSVSSTSICAGASATLTASHDAGAGATYRWSPGGATTQSITVSPAVTTDYTVEVTSAAGCSGSNTSTVAVEPLPVATITTATNVCPNSTGNVASVPDAGAGVIYTWTV